MRRIAHLSDLHFGTEDPFVVAGLARDLAREKADLVLVSGDLTQRARSHEFEAAVRFLRALSVPWLAVPGNHDIPLHNMLRRLGDPYSKYRQALGPDLMPRYSDPEVAVLGLNTAYHLAWKGGLVRRADLAALRGWAAVAGGRLRIVVSHHPFTRPSAGGHGLVRRSSEAVRVMEEAGVDVVLTGHHHVGGHSESRAFVASGPHRLVIVRAGTATSVRRRGEPNSYNLLRVDARQVVVEERRWEDTAFASAAVQAYPRRGP